MNIGDWVMIRFAASGGGDIVKAPTVFQRVTAVYLDGRCKVSSGDIYVVRRLFHNPEADWQAVR